MHREVAVIFRTNMMSSPDVYVLRKRKIIEVNLQNANLFNSKLIAF